MGEDEVTICGQLISSVIIQSDAISGTLPGLEAEPVDGLLDLTQYVVDNIFAGTNYTNLVRDMSLSSFDVGDMSLCEGLN